VPSGGVVFSYPPGNNGFPTSVNPNRGSTHHFGVEFEVANNVEYSVVLFQWMLNGEPFGGILHADDTSGPSHRVTLTLRDVSERYNGVWTLVAFVYLDDVRIFQDETRGSAMVVDAPPRKPGDWNPIIVVPPPVVVVVPPPVVVARPPAVVVNVTTVQVVQQVNAGRKTVVVNVPSGTNNIVVPNRTVNILVQNNVGMTVVVGNNKQVVLPVYVIRTIYRDSGRGNDVNIDININVTTPAPPEQREPTRKSFNKNRRPNRSRRHQQQRPPSVTITTNVEIITVINVEVVVNNQVMVVFDAPYTVVLDLSDVVAVVSNPHRLALIDSDGNFVPLSFDEETGLFTFSTLASGDFTVVYIESLRKLSLVLGSTVVVDLAQPDAEIPNIGTAPVVIGNVVFLPVMLLANSLDFVINWDGISSEFTIIIDGQEITISIGAPAADADSEDSVAADTDEDSDSDEDSDEDSDSDDEDSDNQDTDEDSDADSSDDSDTAVDTDADSSDDTAADTTDDTDADTSDDTAVDTDADTTDADTDDDVYVQLINGHIMVSLSFLVEIFGFSTSFNVETGVITVISVE